MASPIQNLSDKAVDVFDKCSSPSSRAGSTVERVGKLDESRVPREAIAIIMTDRSTNKTKWTVEKVGVVSDLYQECKTKVLITSIQATALMDIYKPNEQDDLDDDAVACPV